MGRVKTSRRQVTEKDRPAFGAAVLGLKAKERREIETWLAKAYAGEAGNLLAEIEEIMGQQSWPSD
jgi:hypothetical protein